MTLDFQPGAARPNRFLCHTVIGQFVVVKSQKTRRWSVLHQGIRISRAEWRFQAEALSEAQRYYDSKQSDLAEKVALP